MSMIGEIRRVSASELARLVREPSDIFWYLHGSEPYQPPASLWGRLFHRKSPTQPQRGTWQAPPDDYVVDLDKSWHCIHFLLADDPWQGPLPAAYLLAGGTEIGGVDVGYGPARALAPEQVAEFHAYLSGITESELRERCNFTRMQDAEVYCALRSLEEFPHLWNRVEALRDLLGAAASAGDGAIVYVY